MEEDFSTVVNYLWKGSMKRISKILTEQEVAKFCSNDFYYLSTIHELRKPNVTMIAEALQVSRPAVSVMIRKLLSMELVETEKSKEDKRVTYVTLTEKGAKIIKGDHELYSDVSNQIKKLVHNETELAIIQNTIRRLARSIINQRDPKTK